MKFWCMILILLSAPSIWKYNDSTPPKKIRQTKAVDKPRFFFIYQHAVLPKNYCKWWILFFSFENFATDRENFKIWKRIGNYVTIMFVWMSLLLLSNMLVNVILKSCNISYPLNSPDRSPRDFWLIPTLKGKGRGKKFNTDSEIISAVHSSLKFASRKKFLYFFWRVGSTMRQSHIIWEKVFWKKNDLFFIVNI